MRKLSDKNFYVLFISLFIILNLVNGYVVSLPIFNPGLNVYRLTFQSFITSFLGDLGFLMIILGIVLLVSRNRKTVVLHLTVISVALSTIIFLLKIYSFYYGTAFSFFNLRTFSNSNPDLGRQLTVFLWKNLLSMGQYIAIFPAIIMIWFAFLTYRDNRFPISDLFEYERSQKHLKLVRIFKVLVLGLGFYSLSTFTFQYKVDANQNNYIVEDLEAIQNMGVYTYLSNDLISYVTNPDEHVNTIDSEKLEQANYYLDEKNSKNPKNFFGEDTSNTAPIFEDKTLILLQLESFNTYLINLVVKDPETGIEYEVTPFLNSLVNNKENLFYENFFSNIGVGKTSDAEFATLTGIFADGNIVTYYDYIHKNYETLPKLFTEKGYETYALRGSNMSFYRREEVYADLGFNPKNLVSEESLIAEGRVILDNSTHKMNGWIDDNIIYDKIIDIIDKDQKQFIFALSTILHSPFTEHEHITGNNGWTEFIPGQIGRYLDYARYTDNALKRMFDILEEKELLDEIVFMLYGDHKSDISIKEHSKLIKEASDLLYNQKLSHNVPLIITSKGIDLSDYADSTSLVRGQTDLKRTISNLFSLNANYNFGVDILSTDKTITYVPLTMDVFTDDFHLNYRGRETDNPDVTEEEIIEFIMLFDKFKTLNDIVLHNDLFLDFNDGT